MDGDVAPLEGLVPLARDHGCRLMVDEAHATGSLGPGGRGSVAAAGLTGEVDIVVGTLGKALGSYGAYACANAEVDRVPAQHRPPLHLLDGAAAARRRRRRGGARDPRSRAGPGRAAARQRRRPARRPGRRGPRRSATRETQIVPVTDRRRPSRRWSSASALLERGVFAQGIRPPTVPEGSSRLRFTVMATHAEAELRDAARLVGAAARELGIAGGGPAGSVPIAA